MTLRKVDIKKWGSPVANQYKIRSLPHLLLYENGKLVAKGTDKVFKRLQ